MNTEPRKFRLHDAHSGAAITVRVIPRAAKNSVVEILDDGTIRVRLVSSKGSQDLDRTLVHFLAEILEIQPGQVEIVAGTSGVDKLVTITGMRAAQVQRKILEAIEQN